MAYGVSEFHELIKSELNLKSTEMQITCALKITVITKNLI